ncbi:MAG TPA: 4Fe-4S binding protein [Candidatus Saccharimonadales bacterium]|nr:4Fe-4S binding protein [Candidatus Saccharimonadales bacterium]
MNTYRPKSKGFGIEDWIKDVIGAKRSTWGFTAKTFKLIAAASRFTKYPVLGELFKRAMMFSPFQQMYSQSVVLPLNVGLPTKTEKVVLPLNIDLSRRAETVVVPIAMMKETVRRAGYILAIDTCICRTGHDCKKYPKDIACIFMGEAARITERHGLGHQVTADEACGIIDRGASLGLIGHAMWVEVEQYIWGFQNEKMENFLEFCFCCDCCCNALKVCKNGTRDVQRRFKTSGWQASTGDSCQGCGTCVDICPQNAISLRNGKAFRSMDCFGCGLCCDACPTNSVTIMLKSPMKPTVEDYFEGLHLDIQ